MSVLPRLVRFVRRFLEGIIKMGLEQVNQQQLGVAANLAAANNLDQVLRSELEAKTETDNSAKVKETILQKVLKGKTPRLEIEILTNLMTKLAKPLNLPQKILGNLEKEYDFVLNAKEENMEDLIDIRSPITRVAKPKGQQQRQGAESGFSSNGGQEGSEGNEKSDVKEYIQAYSQMLVSGGSEVKKTIKHLEQNLLDESGFTLKELHDVKKQTANAVRSELLHHIKHAYLKEIVSQSKSVEWLLANKEKQEIIDFAANNHRVGGRSFGGQHKHLGGALQHAANETGAELKGFIDEELSNCLVRKGLGEEGEAIEKEIETLVKLGTKVGYDMLGFIKKAPDLKEHLGLNQVITIEYGFADSSMDNNSQQRQSFQYTPEEEKEVLTDKMRALFMKRALHGDIRTVLETQFKMIKTKNGLIKLGVVNFDEIEAEGSSLAKVKLFAMLQEAFEERATYAKLSGPAHQMTERKIKTILRNLEKLGTIMTDQELNQIRDHANAKMYEVAEHELNLIQTAIGVHGEMKYLTSKRKLAQEILRRVRAESSLQIPEHKIKLDIQEAC